MRAVDLIAKKRTGGEHTETEIHFLVGGYSQGAIPDYQMSAWLMAVLWRGLTDREMFVLTEAMVMSGETLALGDLAATAVDKHSTGGVGDKTTLAVVPILAAGGVAVAKMSGRGLGHTGGTLDKLDAIPGMRTALSIDEILTQTRAVGACIAAQTESLVPADRKMYALRDATATVESLPLIAASIMSKKLAAGSRNIILDVKVGSGAFMKTLDEARALADAMVRIGEAHGRRVVAVLSDMNVPLGYNVGNLLEVCEVVSLLRNNAGAERRLRHVVKTLCGIGFVLAGCAGTSVAGEAIAEELIVSGKAFEKLLQIVAAQGGDAACLEQTVRLPQCRVRRDVPAPRSGYVTALDAEAIGLAAMRLGAGRATKEDAIDPAAGVMLRYVLGDKVSAGLPIATLCAGSEIQAREAERELLAAIRIGPEPPHTRPLIYETVGFS
jgi:pyrimidine-nucleoside phosphorylase